MMNLSQLFYNQLVDMPEDEAKRYLDEKKTTW